MGYSGGGWQPYVSVAARRRQAARKIAQLKKDGWVVRPVVIAGRVIAGTFWGKSWCTNLERYSDFENRLPRGRSYVRNGSVVDLQIAPGGVRALVSGSSLYEVAIDIKHLSTTRWQAIKSRCAGKVDSMVALLQGSISKAVMEIVTREGEGLFPTPEEITLKCSCPDWATMCKHVAATLYGVGARLDDEPGMLFTLRGVEPTELIAAAISDVSTTRENQRGRVLQSDDMEEIFGIDLDMGAANRPASDVKEQPRTSMTKSRAKAARNRSTKRKYSKMVTKRAHVTPS